MWIQKLLYYLRFDSIDDSGNMRYFGTLKLKYVDIMLNQNLLGDIMFFKDIMKGIKQEIKKEFKCFQDKVVIMGEFIFEYTSSAIYNRFSRCFGGKLSWFKYTPSQIIQLSETMMHLKNNKSKTQSLNLIQDSIDILQQNLNNN